MISLPRQARDKHRENSNEDAFSAGFLAGEMPLCKPSSLVPAEALRYTDPSLRANKASRTAAAAAGGVKGTATLDSCVAFLPKATISLEEVDGSIDTHAHTLALKPGGSGGGRKAAAKAKKAKKVQLPIADAKLAAGAIEFLRTRQGECTGAAGKENKSLQCGFVVGALPGPDAFSKLALAQTLVKHSVAAVESVDVRMDEMATGLSSPEERAEAYAQADSLCNLAVQQRSAGTGGGAGRAAKSKSEL
jgi:hypothetical protein